MDFVNEVAQYNSSNQYITTSCFLTGWPFPSRHITGVCALESEDVCCFSTASSALKQRNSLSNDVMTLVVLRCITDCYNTSGVR